MIKNLFEFLEKNETVLSEDLKNTISESFNIALKEKTDGYDVTIKESEKKAEELKTLLREAAEEIKALRTSKTEEVKKAVQKFEESMVNKLDKYLEFKLKDAVPQSLLEAQAKVEVLEPLVESIKSSFAAKGMKIDEKGFEILKEAKTEITTQRDKYDVLMKEKLALEVASEKLLGKYLLKEKCEGLTPEQTKRVNTLLENSSYDEIEKRFDTIRKLVINEVSKKDEKNEKNTSKKRITEDVVSKENKNEDLGQRLI